MAAALFNWWEGAEVLMWAEICRDSVDGASFAAVGALAERAGLRAYAVAVRGCAYGAFALRRVQGRFVMLALLRLLLSAIFVAVIFVPAVGCVVAFVVVVVIFSVIVGAPALSRVPWLGL